jgi:hypothetical protein
MLDQPVLHKETDDQRMTRLREDVEARISDVVATIKRFEMGVEKAWARSPSGFVYDDSSSVLRRMYSDLVELRRARQELS